MYSVKAAGEEESSIALASKMLRIYLKALMILCQNLKLLCLGANDMDHLHHNAYEMKFHNSFYFCDLKHLTFSDDFDMLLSNF